MKKIVFFMLLLSLMMHQIALAQKPVTGKVVSDKDGLPIASATITVKNSRAATVSATDGTFTINAPDKGILVISYVGYAPVEFPVSSFPGTIRLSMADNLSEIVVTGYRTGSRRDFAGSASTIKSDKIKSVPIASFDQALQGQVPGILVQAQSGQPGASASVLIRGRGSVLGSNAPLYILDGIEITGGDFSTLNPSDFETLSVLKDASATSVYGSRGANGVIVITSKKRKNGCYKIELRWTVRKF